MVGLLALMLDVGALLRVPLVDEQTVVLDEPASSPWPPLSLASAVPMLTDMLAARIGIAVLSIGRSCETSSMLESMRSCLGRTLLCRWSFAGDMKEVEKGVVKRVSCCPAAMAAM